MSDLISRQDAIEAIEGIDWYSQDKNKEMTEGAYEVAEAWYKAEDIYQALEQLPSPLAEKTDEGIEWRYICECPNCGEDWDCCDNDTYRFKYCPNCGATMGGDTLK